MVSKLLVSVLMLPQLFCDFIQETFECITGEVFGIVPTKEANPSDNNCSYWRTVAGKTYLPGYALDQPLASTNLELARRHCARLGSACGGITRQFCRFEGDKETWIFTLRAASSTIESEQEEMSWLKEDCSFGLQSSVDAALDRKPWKSDDGEWCVIGHKVLAFNSRKACRDTDSRCWLDAQIVSISTDGSEARVTWMDGDDTENDGDIVPLKRILHKRWKNWCTTTLYGLPAYFETQKSACINSNHEGLYSLCSIWVDVVKNVMQRWLRQWEDHECVSLLSTSHSWPTCYAPYYDWYWKATIDSVAQCWSLTAVGGTYSLNECFREMVFIALNSAKHVEQFDEVKVESTRLFEAVKRSDLSAMFPWENLYQTPYFIQNTRPFAEFDPAVFLLPGDQYAYRSPRDAKTGWYDTSVGFLQPIARSLRESAQAIKRELYENNFTINETLWGCHDSPQFQDTVLAIMSQTGRCTYGIWGTGTAADDWSCSHMPTLCKALQPHFPTTDHPRYAEGIGLARLKPGGNVPVHRDPHRCFIFMCIWGCEDAVMQIGPTLHEYAEGIPISFDGSVDHGMWNNGTTDRVVVQITASSLEYDSSFEERRLDPAALTPRNDRFSKRITS